jgi:hypothetical protein
MVYTETALHDFSNRYSEKIIKEDFNIRQENEYKL